MTFAYIFFGVCIILVLLVVAGYFGLRQIKTAQALRANFALSADERGFLRRQVRRRLICCVLMVLLALLLAGWFVIESQLPEHRPNNPEEKPPWLEWILYYWAFLLLVLFSLLGMAGIDLVATGRFGLRSHRLLVSERRAVLEAEVKRLRQERRERNGT